MRYSHLWFLTVGVCLLGCQPTRPTERISVREGPTMRIGRMSSSLAAVKLPEPDGRVLVVGGSPKESPFVPITGNQTTEFLSKDWSRWDFGSVDIPFPLSGSAFVLPDGRVLVFAANYPIDPTLTDIAAPDKGNPASAPVSAVIIDAQKNTFYPLYRPENNKPGSPPIGGKKNEPALMQRAFARSIQLRDGRILRIGGRSLILPPKSETRCVEDAEKKEKDKKFCRYCVGQKCHAHTALDYTCQSDTYSPSDPASPKTIYHPEIEIYTPPSGANPLGAVSVVRMEEGRRHTAAIELKDGRILISGGQGPQGQGPEEVFETTYILDLSGAQPKISQGPRMLIPREDHSNALLDDGRVLLTGGTDQNGTTVNLTEIFDPTTNTLSDGQAMDLSREDHLPVRLGSWLLFLGGEVSSKDDQIRNSGEIFDAKNGQHIGSFFLFSLFLKNEDLDKIRALCPGSRAVTGLAGIDDFAVVVLDSTHVMLLGGQQGCQDRDGEYISPGQGSRRTLILDLPASSRVNP